jgi:hypothetical protein
VDAIAVLESIISQNSIEGLLKECYVSKRPRLDAQNSHDQSVEEERGIRAFFRPEVVPSIGKKPEPTKEQHRRTAESYRQQ